MDNRKIYLFLSVILIVYVFLNLPIVKNCAFIADDLPVIYFSNNNPFPIATYWENGIRQLIPSIQIESVHYRPLTSLLSYITFSVFHFEVPYWALLSQLIHLVNFFLVIVIFSKIQNYFSVKNKYVCLTAASLYLFYPGNVTNLAWVSARTDLVVILFCLVSFYFAFVFIEKNKKFFLVASALVYLAALLSKENAASWFIVEFILIWLLYFLNNKPPALFSSLVKIFNAKITALIVFVFCRSALASLETKTLFTNLNIFSTIIAYVKSVLFTFLPVDSGTLIYFYAQYKLAFFVMAVFYCAAFLFILWFAFAKRKYSAIIFSGIGITLSTLSFYAIAGGGTYRLFSLTFVSFLIFVFIFLSSRLKSSEKIKMPLKISYSIVIVLFLLGYYTITNYWLTNYKVQEESLSSLTNTYDKGKENLIINYPHSFGQSYCFSDIGVYLFFKMNNSIGRFNNITSLAAINSFDAGHYISGGVITKNGNDFIVSSDFNDTYFTHEPFYTQKYSLGIHTAERKDAIYEVLKVNTFSKPLSVKITPGINTASVNVIKFENGKFVNF